MAMTDDHKERLRKNRVSLISFLKVEPTFLAAMRVDDIFTEDMAEEVDAERTKQNKASKVLDMIVRRGGRAFNRLLLAIKQNEQPELIEKIILPSANIRDKASIDAIIQLVSDCPFEADVAVIPMFDTDRDARKKLPESLRPYTMKRCEEGRKSGRAVIVIYGPQTEIATFDSRMVFTLLNQLNFDTVIEHEPENLNAFLERENKKIAEREDTLEQSESSDAYVLFLLNSSSAGYKMTPDEIKSYFNADKCPTLANKPKIFFQQSTPTSSTCLGNSGGRKTASIQDEKLSFPVQETGGMDIDSVDGGENEASKAERADQIFIELPYSKPGRREKSCSVFIACLVHSIATHAHSADLLMLLGQVGDVWQQCLKGCGDNYNVMPCLQKTSSLRYAFYFSP